MSEPGDRKEEPPEGVRSTPGPAPGEPGSSGPMSVRDLMKQMTPRPEPAGAGAGEEPRWEAVRRGFDLDGESWLVRSAGAGAYGTGRLGAARLVAVHFFRESDPATPVREALIPAGVFDDLATEELRALFDRATPIDLDR